MKKLVALVASGLTVTMSQAAIDTAAITAASADIALVGGAVFALVVGIKVFKWIRQAL